MGHCRAVTRAGSAHTREGAVTPPRAVLGNTGARGQRAAAGLGQPFIQTTGLGAPQRRPPHTGAGIGPHRATPVAPQPGTGLQADNYRANVHGPEVSGSWSCQKLPPPCTGQGCPPGTKAVSSGFLPLTTKNILKAVLSGQTPEHGVLGC